MYIAKPASRARSTSVGFRCVVSHEGMTDIESWILSVA